MKYADFIAELKRIIDEGRAISEAGITDKDPRFRKWRHEAESTVEETKARGFRLPGEFNSSSRAYSTWPGAGRDDNVEALRAELSDSIVELQFIVEQYRKYGAPQRPAAPASLSAPLTVPERVTLAWLWKNVPVTLWLAAVGLALSFFGAGVTVCQTETYRSVESFVRSVISTGDQ